MNEATDHTKPGRTAVRAGAGDAAGICLSMVSHGQAGLANLFLSDLGQCPELARTVVIENRPDTTPITLPAGATRHLVNPVPMGFAHNHNQAFGHCEQPFFCVANPDIRLSANPFPGLLACFDDPRVGVVAPLVLNPAGQTEDNARYFPSPWNLLVKALGGPDGRYDTRQFQPGQAAPVEWAAGMFLLFRASAFRDVGGFDDKFHLYYEDVDICTRLWKSGWKVMLKPDVTVVHAAQRASRRNPQYTAWHAASMARYFFKHFGRLPRTEPIDSASPGA
jgi:N-acetylglucosaminyl-diphospho-decaprenol L-rhamnosyltransferase